MDKFCFIIVIVSTCTYKVLSFDTVDTFLVGTVRGSQRNKGPSPTKALGSSCKADGECLTAYAACVNAICRCRPGFRPDSQSRCSSKQLSCPYGSPVSTNRAQSIACTVTTAGGSGGGLPPPRPIGRRRRQTGHSVVTDSCPGNSFCLLHSASFSNNQEGHCCPIPKAECPVGQPDARYSCDEGLVTIPIRNTGNKKYCPQDSHYCTSFGDSWSPALQHLTVCCPRPCASGSILKNGVCYRSASLGEECQVTEQCKQFSLGICQNGRCICGPDTVANDKTCTVPYCPSASLHVGQPKPLALRNADGTFKSCQRINNVNQCGANAMCHNSYCCLRPKPTCPNNPSLVLSSPQYCNPYEPPVAPNICPRGQFCVDYEYGPENRKGLCCSTISNTGPDPIGK